MTPTKYLPVALTVCAAAMIMGSCQKEDIDTYSGPDAIYFDQHWGKLDWKNTNESKNLRQNYSVVPFRALLVPDSTILVNVQTSGFARDWDRPFSVEVVSDSTTAIEGVEFELPQKDFVIPAGDVRINVPVVCHRSKRMETDTIRLQLRLVPGPDFVAPFGPNGIGDLPILNASAPIETKYAVNYDAMIHDVILTAFLDEPLRWNSVEYNLGVYSAKKLQLLIELCEEKLGWPEYYWTSDQMEYAQKMWGYYGGTRYQTGRDLLAQYLVDQFNKGPEHWVLDPDSTMMWVRHGMVTWAEETKPSDLKK